MILNMFDIQVLFLYFEVIVELLPLIEKSFLFIILNVFWQLNTTNKQINEFFKLIFKKHLRKGKAGKACKIMQ